jgi:ubiquinone/menaquinone biosynthesis C-methylase UbiE
LGGRDTVIPGFKTVDLHSGPTVDIVANISDLSMIESGTVDEIYASHCLEHFPHPQTPAVLKEWRRVLKVGASCWISVPDFDAAVRLYLKEGMGDFIRNLLWGDQGYDLAYHYTGFTYPTLAALLVNAGFQDIKRHKWMQHRVKDCSRLIDNIYKEPLSLTLQAIA